ncbi:DNA-binding protein [Chelatococcus sp. CO-6]|nr:DNA-binding protein [Chelatococcus sp. CO-6]
MITANNSYYPLDRVPEFWEWLVHMGNAGHLKMPIENLEEITNGTDDLADWLKAPEHKEAICLDESVDITLLQQCTAHGYAPDLNDTEVVKLGKDPFLIAYAMAAPQARCVVTTEVSKPSLMRANRHVPDVCNTLGIQWINSFGLLRALDFSTGWKTKVAV